MKNTTKKEYEIKWGFNAPPRSLQTRKLPSCCSQKYRVKRYLTVKENVVIGLPLNARGGKNKNLTENNIINSNNIYINNKQQPQVTLLPQQLEKQRKCGEIFSSNINSNSLSVINLSSLITTKKQIKLTTQKTTHTRIPAIRKTKACLINFSSREKKKKILQLIETAIAAAEATCAEAIFKKYKKRGNIKIDFNKRGVSDITTRLINNTKLNKKSTQNKIKNNKGKGKKTIQHDTSNKSGNNKLNSNPKEVNKFCFVSRLFIQLKLLLFSLFTHTTKHLKQSTFAQCVRGGGGSASVGSSTVKGCSLDCCFADYYLEKMMRASQLLQGSFERICFKNARELNLSVALYMMMYVATAFLLFQPVAGDDGDTFFPTNGLETTTPEFDYASRGQKKFGDKCDNTLECGFPGSICDPKKKSCQCTEDLPVTNHIDKCGKEAAVNESCFFNEQCEVKYFQTECRDQRCVCRFDMTPIWLKDGSVECKGRGDKKGPETYIDPAMIGVLIGMALMFIIICVVLRLFSQARWHENRTIFNTPNPRLMNVSLLRESKLLHGQERRGSRMSVRAPSRQPSMASLRPHSPNPSLGKTGSRSNSHGSNASATSLRSTRSNSVSPAGTAIANNAHHERKGSTYQPHQHQHPQQQKLQPLQQQDEQQLLTQTNIISNPVAETVTVEIIEPEK